MLSLADLLNSERGIDFLADRGFYTGRQPFLDAMKPPARSGLATLLGQAPTLRLVYVGQQICADYERPTVAKFLLARDIESEGQICCPLLWHDMFQADADRFGTRILPPGGGKALGIWLIPRSAASHEPRLIPADPERLEDAWARLGVWINNARGLDRTVARAKLQRLADAVGRRRPSTLAEVNGAIASLLLRDHCAFAPLQTFASAMADSGVFTGALNNYLAQIDDVLTVFNSAVDELIAYGIDPKVKPLAEDYLPLHYSCPADGMRLRLKRERSGGDQYASATCRCGICYRFSLGTKSLSLGELEQAGRWSLDVSMPVYHNDLASGWVAGRSTALYGLVFNRVLEKVMDQRPIPAVIPTDLAITGGANGEGPETTLLFAYLSSPMGSEMGA